MNSFPSSGSGNQAGFGMQGGPYMNRQVSSGCAVAMGILFAVIGLAVLVFGVTMFAKIQQLHTSHEITTGTLGNCSTTRTSNRNGTSTSTTCTVVYSVNGAQYTISTSSDTIPGQVTVYYDPSNPGNAQIAQDYNSINPGVWVILFGIAFVVIGGGTAAAAAIRRTPSSPMQY